MQAQPQVQLDFAKREASRYREDIESWKADHDALANGCWVIEQLIAVANRNLDRFIAFDASVRKASRAGVISESQYDYFDSKSVELLEQWLETSRVIAPEVRRLLDAYGAVDGADEFFRRIREVEAMLATDDEFFDSEEIADLRDAAIDAARRGDVEPAFDDLWPQ